MNARIISVIVASLLLSLVVQSVVARGEYETVDRQVNLQGDPGMTSSDVINMDNVTEGRDKSAVARWNSDMGESLPKGVYYGPLYECTLWKMSMNNPSAVFPDENIIDIITNHKNYYLSINLFTFINETIIMNGASEFWVDVPAQPDSKSIMHAEDGTDIWADSMCIISSPINATLDTSSHQYLLGKYVNGHFYAKMNLPLLPSIDTGENDSYPVSMKFTLSYVESNPGIYLTNEMLGRPSLDLKYNYINSNEQDTYMRMDGVYANNTLETKVWYDYYFTYLPRGLIDPANQAINIPSSQHLYLPYDISFGYSIIFTEGIGEGGVIGLKQSIEPNEYFKYTHRMHVKMSELTTNPYISVYIPFISREAMNISAVNFFIIGAYYEDSTYTDFVPWSDVEYKEFLLLSGLKKVNKTTIWGLGDDRTFDVILTVYLRHTWNGTFLAYIADGDSDLSALTVYKNTVIDSLPLAYGVAYGFNLVLQNSVWPTSGVWNQMSTYGNGTIYIIHYYPINIFTGTNIFYVTVNNQTEAVEVNPIDYWDEAMKEFGSIGIKGWNIGKNVEHLALGIKYAFLGVVQKLWSVGETLWGWIQTGISWLADKLSQIGEFIQHFVKQFVGFIKDVINFIREKIVPILSMLFLLIICMFALAVIGLGSKAILALGGE